VIEPDEMEEKIGAVLAGFVSLSYWNLLGLVLWNRAVRTAEQSRLSMTTIPDRDKFDHALQQLRRRGELTCDQEFGWYYRVAPPSSPHSSPLSPPPTRSHRQAVLKQRSGRHA